MFFTQIWWRWKKLRISLFRVTISIKKKDDRGAIEVFSQAIKLNPNYAEACDNRGSIRYGLGDNQGAIGTFLFLKILSPKYQTTGLTE